MKKYIFLFAIILLITAIALGLRQSKRLARNGFYILDKTENEEPRLAISGRDGKFIVVLTLDQSKDRLGAVLVMDSNSQSLEVRSDSDGKLRRGILRINTPTGDKLVLVDKMMSGDWTPESKLQ